MKKIVLSYKQLAEVQQRLEQGYKLDFLAAQLGISNPTLRRELIEAGISPRAIKSQILHAKTEHTCKACGLTKPKNRFAANNFAVCKPCLTIRRVAAKRQSRQKNKEEEPVFCFPTKYYPAGVTMRVTKFLKRKYR